MVLYQPETSIATVMQLVRVELWTKNVIYNARNQNTQ